MKAAALVLLALAGCAHPPAPAGADRIGRIYSYVRSNRDGSEAEQIHVFRASRTRIEVTKMRERCTNAAFVTAELDLARGTDPWFDAAVGRLSAELADPDALPLRARRIAGLLALCLQASLLLRHAPAEVADAFCATRLGGDYNGTLGTLPVGTNLTSIVERTTPVVA